jgi:hypothetical protein
MALLTHRSATDARGSGTAARPVRPISDLRVQISNPPKASRVRTLAFSLLALIALCPGSDAQVSREYDVKAVFLLNFAQFVEWPSEAFASAEEPFIIGVLGADPFQGALEKVIRDERVHTRPVMMHRYQRVEEIDACHILFINAGEARRMPRILKALQGRPVLTVSETDEFLAQGGVIRFVTENAKVRLRINNDAARAARLLISAKLLRVAEVVNPEPRP